MMIGLLHKQLYIVTIINGLVVEPLTYLEDIFLEIMKEIYQFR